MKVQISAPLFEDGELDKFDNYINKVIEDYTKLKLKKKEQILTQRIIKIQQQKIDRLNNIIFEVINLLEPFVEIDMCIINGKMIKPALDKLKGVNKNDNL